MSEKELGKKMGGRAVSAVSEQIVALTSSRGGCERSE